MPFLRSTLVTETRLNFLLVPSCSLIFARCLLLFARCSLLFTRCSLLLLIVCNLLLFARCSSLVTFCSVLVARYFLLVARYRLLVARYFLVVAHYFFVQITVKSSYCEPINNGLTITKQIFSVANFWDFRNLFWMVVFREKHVWSGDFACAIWSRFILFFYFHFFLFWR